MRFVRGMAPQLGIGDPAPGVDAPALLLGGQRGAVEGGAGLGRSAIRRARHGALPVAGVSPFWQMAISGLAILAAVAFNARAERRAGRVILKSAEGVPA